MAKFKFFGISEADAEIKSADAAINPLLTAAKITTIEVNGKPIPATSDEVPLALKISNLAATYKEGAGDKEVSELTRNNSILADQAKVLETRAVTAETNSAAVTRENVVLAEKITVLEGGVAKLTAENAELITLRAAANKEAGRVTAESNAINTEISRKALAWNAISDLRDEKGNVLSSKSTEAEKLAAADRIPVAQKLTAIGGAVTAALQRAGVPNGQSPAQPVAGSESKTPKLTRAEFFKLDPKAQTAFFDMKGTFID
jgi:hypothetical protein